jgi:hypothetical protein
MARARQPDQSVFGSCRTRDDWKPFPAFPLAAGRGEPTKPSPYTIRVKLPAQCVSVD